MSGTITDRIDGISTSVAVKAPVKVCATANITLSGEQTIDGVAVVAGDRVLVPLQTDATTRGVYQVKTGAWSRDKDFDGARDIVQGTLIPVNLGTVNGGKILKVSTANPIIINTTSLAFEDIGLIDQDYLTQITDALTDAENAAIAAEASAVATAALLSNGDRGDITISGGGATWTIDNGNVTRTKLATGAVAPVNVTSSKTANYTATTDDDFIPCNATSGAFTVTLYAASGNAGRRITIKKTDSTFNNVTIDANASETIDGATTRRLCTQFEELVLVCDGSNWFIENRIIPSIWTTYTTTLSHSSGGITNNTNSFRYRRIGDSIEIMGTIAFSAASAAFTGLFATIPSGLTIDSGKMTTATNFIQPIGQVNFLDSGVATYRGDVLYVASSGGLEIQYNISSTANVTGGTTTNAAPFTYGASDAIGITTHRIPVTNWEG